MKPVTLVVAGSYQQFRYWYGMMGSPRSWKYIATEQHAKGYSPDTDVLLVGQWWLSEVDAQELRVRFFDVREMAGTNQTPRLPEGTEPWEVVWMFQSAPLIPFKRRRR